MFYRSTLRKLIDQGVISTDDKVLVVCGGSYDADTLMGLGFSTVTLSNLDRSFDGHTSDYVWERQDTENLSYRDGQFDVAIVHAGLHHCPSPHRALLEMYRVARKAVVVFESRDSLMMRTAVVFGFTNDFELEAVSHEGYESGGLNNGPIPNLNYRWTEREVTKVVRAADPAHVENITFFYGLRLPTLRFEHVNAPVKRIALKLMTPAVQAFVKLFPKQGNQFGFVIAKTGKLREWLEEKDGVVRLSREKAERRGQAYR
jgi:ubiquinone/menaquinone biosynthesis C-methylase UbiE